LDTCIASVDVEALKNRFPNLEVLDVTNKCGIKSFSDEYKNATWPSLTHLNLSGNAITKIQADDLTGFVSLKNVNVSYNLLESFALGASSGLNKLEILDLSNNRLTSISLDSKISLKNINLTFNQLESLSLGAFSGLKNLEILNLSDNRLTTITPDSNMSCCPGVFMLGLNNNNLRDVSNLKTFSNLQKLHITNNSQLLVKTLPLHQFPNLAVLRMNNASLDNSIEQLSKFEEAKNLRGLSLSRNSKNVLDLKNFPLMKHLKYINLLELTIVGHQYLQSKFPALRAIKISTKDWDCELWDDMILYLAETNITWFEKSVRPESCPTVYHLGSWIWYILPCIWSTMILVAVSLAWGIHKFMLTTPTTEKLK
jgi:Leucine-rich repeat (LRR) protein